MSTTGGLREAEQRWHVVLDVSMLLSSAFGVQRAPLESGAPDTLTRAACFQLLEIDWGRRLPSEMLEMKKDGDANVA